MMQKTNKTIPTIFVKPFTVRKNTGTKKRKIPISGSLALNNPIIVFGLSLEPSFTDILITFTKSICYLNKKCQRVNTVENFHAMQDKSLNSEAIYIETRVSRQIPGNCFSLSSNHILALQRDDQSSRA